MQISNVYKHIFEVELNRFARKKDENHEISFC